MSELPCLIALDTATEVVHLALCHGERTWVKALGGGAQASASTLPGVQALLADAGVSRADLQAIAFGRGPGAFTGLRTACSVAQGLALGLGLPVLPLDTLAVVAESARRRSPELAQALATQAATVLWVLQDARMNEVYAQPLAWQADTGWRALAAPVLWPVAWMAERNDWPAGAWACGSALHAYPEPSAALQARGVACVPGTQPDGEALAELARRAWAQGLACDAALALPLYVRDKVAQTTAERMAVRATEPAAGLVAQGTPEGRT
jgi:tRNA threonylcarbamoyladenosine biosynthesis protein TsaB